MFGPLLTCSGLIPFLAYSATGQRLVDHNSLYLNCVQDALITKKLNQTNLQLSYGAAILSFLGGSHWGFAHSNFGSSNAAVNAGRLGYGVIPSLVAWGFINAETNVAIDGLSAGLLGAFCVDGLMRAGNLVPRSYFRLRAVPTVLGALCMQSNHDRYKD